MAELFHVILWVIILSGSIEVTTSRVALEKCQDSTSQTELNSFLWLIKRSPPAYFFGTIHVPYTRVWDYIPINSKEAFTNSQNVYFELDLTNESTMRALVKCQLLPTGKLLKHIIPRRMYKRLKSHLKYIRRKIPSWLHRKDSRYGTHGTPYADRLYELLTKDWERKRPIWVMLMVNSLTESDIRNRGIPVLDQYLAIQASRGSKLIGAVENVEEQCSPLNTLNVSQVIFALNQSLHFQERLRRGKAHLTYTTDDLINHYNCGDLKTILFSTQSTQVSPLTANSTREESQRRKAQNIDSYFRNELIYQRNVRMARRVVELLRDNPEKDFFFAFGAGHFLGNHSIIDLIKKEGYGIEYVKSTQNLPSYKAKKSILTNKEFPKKRGCRGRRKRKKKCESLRNKKRPDYSRVRLLQKATRRPYPSNRPVTSVLNNDVYQRNMWSRNAVSRPEIWTMSSTLMRLVLLNVLYGVIR
ncbi:metalloprotease TIKI homolog [Actinia tenebrosa]|uniref:Metalloprotease TIKI homolog n=1 Tax=Actinia tenebrosa TaxID=6105 RepID=A0A6P8IN77_ACTTE|nr:metalloprotease TIKI homolog [Actinia tenebrosa]